MQFKLTRHIKWILINTILLLLILTLYRGILFNNFNSTHQKYSSGVLWYGFRYDLRVAFIILLPVYLLTGFFSFSPFKNSRAKKIWTFILTTIYSILIIWLVFDYQYYAYRSNRLDAEVLGFMKDAGISMQMVWESYPVLKIGLYLLLMIVTIYFIVKKIIEWSAYLSPIEYNPNKKIVSIIFFFMMAFGIYGKFGTFPLRWSDAFSLNNDFKANMALNPFQSFFSSLQFKDEKPDVEKVKHYYPFLSSIYKLPTSDSSLNFNRNITANATTKPNIVVVLCESFSFYKSSMCGNPLNPTPHFAAMTKEGIFFTKCFSPAFGTARGVWATITGIPDITLSKTATRNPRAVEQHTIINDFNGYDKYYFLGGDPSWANIRGLIKNNITDVKLFEQDDYSSPKVDVWGISDRNLFKEATSVLNKNTNPFFAVIQTANNHRPFTIPSNDATEMGLINKPLDSLLQFGYNVESDTKKTNEEFNAMRYMDFCINDFIENAKKQPWYNNTVFLFIGDHGIRGDGGKLIPKLYNDKGLTCEHIPMLIYSKLLQPEQHNFPCSQIDVLPTLAGIANINYRNSTLGRDLLQVAKDTMSPKFAFIIDHDVKEYGIIDNNNYYFKQLKGKKEGLIPLQNTSNKTPISYYQNLANSILETSRYLMYNNK